MSVCRRIMVVEDDPQWAEILGAVISLHGWVPVVAHTMGEAIANLAHQPVYVTLLDLRLPDCTSEMTIDRIRMLKAMGAGRVLVVTGAEVTAEMLEALLAAGADSAITKAVHGFRATLDAILCP